MAPGEGREAARACTGHGGPCNWARVSSWEAFEVGPTEPNSHEASRSPPTPARPMAAAPHGGQPGAPVSSLPFHAIPGLENAAPSLGMIAQRLPSQTIGKFSSISDLNLCCYSFIPCSSARVGSVQRNL